MILFLMFLCNDTDVLVKEKRADERLTRESNLIKHFILFYCWSVRGVDPSLSGSKCVPYILLSDVSEIHQLLFQVAVYIVLKLVVPTLRKVDTAVTLSLA